MKYDNVECLLLFQAPGQDRQTDFPRQRDRQFAAQLLPDLNHLFRRRQREPRDPGDAFAAGASAAEIGRAGEERARPHAALGTRQYRQTAAGIS